MRANKTKPVPKPTIAGVPQHIVDACYAGLDDIKHGRTVPGEVVLAEINRKLADYYKKKKTPR